jgi:RecA-family ATPase
VLYFDQELGLDEMKRRLAKIHTHRKGMRADRNLMVISKDRSCKLDSDIGLATIKKYIAEAKADVIILDPLICFHSRDENDNTEMHKVLEAIAGLGCAVIVLHHFGKPSETRHGSNPARARGASTIWGDCDTFVSISRPDANDKNRLMLEYSLRFDTEPCPTKLDWDDNTGVFKVAN